MMKGGIVYEGNRWFWRRICAFPFLYWSESREAMYCQFRIPL